MLSEGRELRIPASREIRDNLPGIQRIVGMNGQINYRVRQSAEGHSDRCTALAPVLRAAQMTALSCGVSVLRHVGRYRTRRRPKYVGEKRRSVDRISRILRRGARAGKG